MPVLSPFLEKSMDDKIMITSIHCNLTALDHQNFHTGKKKYYLSVWLCKMWNTCRGESVHFDNGLFINLQKLVIPIINEMEIINNKSLWICCAVSGNMVSLHSGNMVRPHF